jgi:VanZ family protein
MVKIGMKQNKIIKRRIVFLILIIIWLCVIFIFSSQSGEESGNTSNKLLLSFINIYEKITNTIVDKDIAIKKLGYPIRKLAHFTEYFILGLFVFEYINTYKTKYKLLKTIAFCFICACLDEVHQMFSIDRGPSFIDSLIDTFGSIVGSSILKLINKKR